MTGICAKQPGADWVLTQQKELVFQRQGDSSLSINTNYRYQAISEEKLASFGPRMIGLGAISPSLSPQNAGTPALHPLRQSPRPRPKPRPPHGPVDEPPGRARARTLRQRAPVGLQRPPDRRRLGFGRRGPTGGEAGRDLRPR